VGESPLLAVPGEGPLRMTASVGAAATDRFPADAAELVRRADEACYQAKGLGRDRVVVVAS
jgi:GGDEF domain-containing protein